MSRDHTDNDRITRTFDEHAATVVDTVNIDGTLVDIIEHVRVTQNSIDAPIDVTRGVHYEAALAGEYDLLAPYATFRATAGEYGDPNAEWNKIGAGMGSGASRTDNRQATLGTPKTAKAAVNAARKVLRDRALVEAHRAAVTAAVRTLTADEFAALPTTPTLNIGDRVAVRGHSAYRVGILVELGKTKVRVLFATPSNTENITFAAGIAGDTVRLVEAAGPVAAAPAPAAEVELAEAALLAAAAEVELVDEPAPAAEVAAIPPAILAALNDPDVCGYLDESGGPCENCTGGVARDLARGATVAEVLADIEATRQHGAELRRAVEPEAPVAVELDADEDRAAVAGRVFVRTQGLDVADTSTCYRMRRARVGRRSVDVYSTAGEHVGTVTEVAGTWLASDPGERTVGTRDGFAEAAEALFVAAAEAAHAAPVQIGQYADGAPVTWTPPTPAEAVAAIERAVELARERGAFRTTTGGKSLMWPALLAAMLDPDVEVRDIDPKAAGQAAPHPFVAGAGADEPVPFVVDGVPIPGYVVGHCGHRVAASEWRAGFRVCERCPSDTEHALDDEDVDPPADAPVDAGQAVENLEIALDLAYAGAFAIEAPTPPDGGRLLVVGTAAAAVKPRAGFRIAAVELLADGHVMRAVGAGRVRVDEVRLHTADNDERVARTGQPYVEVRYGTHREVYVWGLPVYVADIEQCTHGGDCKVHPRAGQVHNLDDEMPPAPSPAEIATGYEVLGALLDDDRARGTLADVPGALRRVGRGLAAKHANDGHVTYIDGPEGGHWGWHCAKPGCFGEATGFEFAAEATAAAEAHGPLAADSQRPVDDDGE